jgi:hypothetical protein
MSLTHKEGQTLMQSARNRAAGKPLQNNTRLYDHADHSFGVVLHGTEVVTIHTDGTYTLRSGGFTTNTTADRIHTYSPAKQFSEKGEWYVWMKPVDRDPRPDRFERSIPRPFEASDPGPEPVKTTEGCKDGQMVTTEHVDELVEVWRKDMLDTDEFIEVISDGHEPGGDYDKVSVKRSWNDHVFYTEDRYWSEAWAKLSGDGHRSSYTNKDGERVRKIQCPHCAEFDAIHERWSRAYNGANRWAAIDQRKGYKLYAEMMERFDNNVDAWQEAYIEDFRARRAYNQADRAWEIRNRVPFYDGITVDSEGYTPRIRQVGPSPAKLRRHEREVVRMQKKIERYIDGYIKALVKGMPMPSGGDCWFCALRTESGQTWGDMGNSAHLLTHMEERYYVPTLAVNALRATTKLTDTGIYLWLDMNQDTNRMGGKKQGKKPYDSVKRALRKYMRKRLVPEPPTS